MYAKEKKELLLRFSKYLRKEEMSDNTITSYLWTVNNYLTRYDTFSSKDLLSYKEYLMSNFSPKTVNLRLLAMNKYLASINKRQMKLKTVRIGGKSYADNIISNGDYIRLKRHLKKENSKYYFMVCFMAQTGCRASELISFTADDVVNGYKQIYSKGRYRMLYIPKKLQKETLEWMRRAHITSGYLFKNKNGEQISSRGISKQLKKYAKQVDISTSVIYPHSFRHLFSKNFLEKSNNNIVFLADILGHSTLDTTMLYLKKSKSEQRELIDKIVTW